jgi:transcriptional regulator with XRE-family HTH domain
VTEGRPAPPGDVTLPGSHSDRHEGPTSLRALRLGAGLTQDQLAELSGLTVRTIRGLEAGRVERPRLSSLDALTHALGLAVSDRFALLETWHLYDPTPATSTLPPAGDAEVEVIEAHLAQSRADLKTIAVNEFVEIGAHRRISARHTQEVNLALSNDVASRYVYYDPLDETVDPTQLHLSALHNCVVNREIHDPERQGVLFDLGLDRSLAAGDTHICRYSADFEAARTTGRSIPPDTGVEIAGFFHAPALYLMEVRFHQTAWPRGCNQVYQARPEAPIRVVRQLSVSGERTYHIALQNPRPGGHGISWFW